MSVDLICPVCRTGLETGPTALCCVRCRRSFPIVAGIPDLRLSGDSYLSLEDDRAKALALDAVDGGYEDVLRAYWARTPEVPDELANRYVAAALDDVRRAERHLDRLRRVDGPLVDIGCGTGGLVVAAARRGLEAMGVDIALRWLVVARRHLAEAGVDAELVAADAARPPYAHGSFATATCIEVLEHAADQRGLLHWCLAAAGAGGHAYVVTANRFSLAPEPTVGLVGTGYLPRSWATAYVRRRRSTRYQHFRALSRHELRALAGPDASIGPAVIPASPGGATASRRLAEAVYERLRRAPAARRPLGAIAPYLEVTT